MSRAGAHAVIQTAAAVAAIVRVARVVFTPFCSRAREQAQRVGVAVYVARRAAKRVPRRVDRELLVPRPPALLRTARDHVEDLALDEVPAQLLGERLELRLSLLRLRIVGLVRELRVCARVPPSWTR